MRFLYIHTGNKYPPDKHLIDGLRENGHEVYEMVEGGANIAVSYGTSGNTASRSMS